VGYPEVAKCAGNKRVIKTRIYTAGKKDKKNNPNLLPSVLLIAKFKNVGSVWGYLYINHIFLDLQIDFSPLSELYC
jgi:hypothetical protein